MLQPEKGGDPQIVKDSQAKRGAPPELVEEVQALYKEWVQLTFQLSQMQREINAAQKEITAKRKAKEDATAELDKKKQLDAQAAALKPKVDEKEKEMRGKAGRIGNIVGDMVPISQTEVSSCYRECRPLCEHALTHCARRTTTKSFVRGTLMDPTPSPRRRRTFCRTTKS